MKVDPKLVLAGPVSTTTIAVPQTIVHHSKINGVSSSLFAEMSVLPTQQPFLNIGDLHHLNSEPSDSPPSRKSSSSSSLSFRSMAAPNPENAPFPPLRVTQADHLLVDFSTMDKARQTLTNFLVRLTRAPISKDYTSQVADLLTKLESRSLKWSSVKFQLITLPATADVHEYTFLNTQLALIPEFRQNFNANNSNGGRGAPFRGRGRGRGGCFDQNQQPSSQSNSSNSRIKSPQSLSRTRQRPSKDFEEDPNVGRIHIQNLQWWMPILL